MRSTLFLQEFNPLLQLLRRRRPRGRLPAGPLLALRASDGRALAAARAALGRGPARRARARQRSGARPGDGVQLVVRSDGRPERDGADGDGGQD